MTNPATVQSEACLALRLVVTENELMTWHDAWMSSDEYTSMSDGDAGKLEEMFQSASEIFASNKP